jgi:hypothetical protein
MISSPFWLGPAATWSDFCDMPGETAARFYRSGEIVVLFGYIRGSVLENAGHEANQLGCIGCCEGGGCAPEVMQTHGFAELGSDMRAGNVVDAACR